MLKSPKVLFFKTSTFNHSDIRRHIIGISGKLNLSNKMKQMKIIFVSDHSVIKKEIIGNHLHKKSSDQWEYIYVINDNKKKFIFEFRYKNYEESIKQKKLKSGDCVIVPPGCALGFLPLEKNSFIIEISNKIYEDNYEKVNLF